MNTTPSENNPQENSDWPLRSFLNLAGLLICALAITGFLAIGFGAYFNYDRDMDNIEKTITVRLNELSNELERRAFLPGVSESKSKSLADLTAALILDLSTRFPDPIVLLDSDGQMIRTIQPDHAIFRNMNGPVSMSPLIPQHIDHALKRDRVQVNVRPRDTVEQISWASTPIYDADGVLVGGLLIQPLNNTIGAEYKRSKMAWLNAAVLVLGVSIVLGFLLSALITERYIREKHN